MSVGQVIQGEGFKLQLTPETGYLRAHVYDGTDSQAVSVAYWRMLGEACRAHGYQRLLVVEELQASVELAAIEPVIQAMVEGGLQAVRIAFVELLDDIEGSEYGEILCRERGITIRTFSDETTARRWLLYAAD